MKKWLSLLLCGVMLISLCACGDENKKDEQKKEKVISTEKKETVQTPKSNEMTVADFNAMMEGVWVDLSNLDDVGEDGTSFVFEVFEQGWVYGGSYPGGMGRSGQVVGVKKVGDDYTLTVRYPEGYEYDEYVAEKIDVLELKHSGDTITFSGSNVALTRMGSNLDEAIIAVDNYYINNNRSSAANSWESNSYGIPEIPLSGNRLDMELAKFKATKGGYLNGPYEGWGEIAADLFTLKNTSGYEWYLDTSDSKEYVGVSNGKIVFFGINGLISSSVKVAEVVPSGVLDTEPKIYRSVSRADDDAYVWKLKNGYLAIRTYTVGNNPREFYNHYVSTIVYVKDVEMLSYVN